MKLFTIYIDRKSSTNKNLTKEYDCMDKSRTIMGVLVGILLGFANGLGFKSMTVGVIVAVCFAILFAYIFNKVKRKKN